MWLCKLSGLVYLFSQSRGQIFSVHAMGSIFMSQEMQLEPKGSQDCLLTEDDSFFLMRLLKYLETEAEQQRLILIAEQIAKSAQNNTP